MRARRSRLLYKFKVKWGYILAQKLESEHWKIFAASISVQTKAPEEVSLEFPGVENIPQVLGNGAKVA